MSDADIRALVESNPGQATFDEYKIVHEVVSARAPCRMLVFGVGRDSSLWLEANRGGDTVFLEDVTEWASFARNAVPEIHVHDVRYGTIRALWPILRHFPGSLRMRGLPNDVSETEWDVILVDAPRGTRWYRAGRMKSVYAASSLGSLGADVFLHDCHRKVERESGDQFLLRPGACDTTG